MKKVMGFVFNDDLTKVALVDGSKISAAGGEVKKGESPPESMYRSFYETAGVEILTWTYIGRLSMRLHQIDIYAAKGGARPMLDSAGAAKWFEVKQLNSFVLEPIMTWLLPLARLRFSEGQQWWKENVGTFTGS